MSEPLILGAIDAGSNAIRVLIAQATADGLIPLITERVPVRLGQGTFSTGTLQSKCIDGAAAAFERFRMLFEEHEVSIYRAVATSAVRSASNREQLLEAIYSSSGIELEVIDAAEEARLVRKAVLSKFVKARAPDVIFDLGGGSLEIMRRSGNNWLSGSTQIGTVRLLETFGLRGAILESERKMIQRYSRASLRNGFDNELRTGEIKSAAFCGGNAECLASLFAEGDKSGMPILSVPQLRDALDELTSADVKTRMAKYKVRKDRAEVMGVAAIVLTVVAKEFQLESFLAPGVGVRDGVILDLAEASVGKLSAKEGAPSLAAARSFGARLGHNTQHAEQVRMIAERLFEVLQELHKLPKQCAMILQLAALLHDVGEVVHRKSHHKHSEYLILQGRIPGLESPIRELVAATARGHRKSLPSIRKHDVFAKLSATHQAQVLKMAVLLRIADTLDANRKKHVVALAADIGPECVVLTASTNYGGIPIEDETKARCEDFKEVFGCRLEIRWTEVSTSARDSQGTEF